MRLADLSHELDELEKGRLALARRVEELRGKLRASGQQTAEIKASVALLCEHVSSVTTVMSDLEVIEEELRTVSGNLEDAGKVTQGMAFEGEGLQDALDEAENELDRISTIMINGKIRSPRGH
jgi:hypothetical protein